MIGFVIGTGLGITGVCLFAYNAKTVKKSKKAYETAMKKYQKDLVDYKERIEKYTNVPKDYWSSVKPREPEIHDFVNDENKQKFPKFVPYVVIGVGAVLVALNCIYPQDPREVVVVRNFGGSLSGYTSEAGFHTKLPWQDTISYDTSNNLINLYRDADYVTNGGSAEGSCVSINDSGGAGADIDLQVIYSFDGDAALQLYQDYGSQESFTKNYILNDVRAVAREVAGRYDTITMLTNRGDFTNGVQKALTDKWKPLGLTVESVSVQDVRYPYEITNKYAEAQAAEVDKAKAENEQKTAQVEAETKKIQAEGEKEANNTLSQSLTDQVLQQHYLDTLKELGENGNVVVVPEGSTPVVMTPNSSK